MANRQAYRDHGLLFAKEIRGRKSNHPGDPLQMNNMGQADYARLVKEAGVKSITVRAIRHMAATIMLKAGVPVKVVIERLSQTNIEITPACTSNASNRWGRRGGDTCEVHGPTSRARTCATPPGLSS